MTMQAIANKLGGINIPECREGAINYCAQCIRVNKDMLVNTQNWTKMPMYWYVEKLSTETSTEAWVHEVEAMSEINEWEEKAMVHKAALAYSAMHGTKVAEVTKEMLETTEIGLKGWASLNVSTVAPTVVNSGVAAKGVAKAKAKAKASAKAPGNVAKERIAASKAEEKKFSHYLAEVKSSKLELERLQRCVEDR